VLSDDADKWHTTGPAIFIKWTVPKSEAQNVLGLLSINQIDGGTLFPGYEGVARVIRERAYAMKKNPGKPLQGELSERGMKLVKRLKLPSKMKLFGYEDES